jgi:hypothetical protein
MKKFFAGMITMMLLVAMMGTTVFASDSPTSEAALKKQAEELSEKLQTVSASMGGTKVEITMSEIEPETVVKGEAALKERNYSSNDVLAMADLKVEGEIDTSKGVTVNLAVEGVLEGDNIHVLHQTGSGSWEELSVSSVGTGSVTVTMTSFSPIMVVRLPAKTTTSSTTSSSGSTGSSTYTSTFSSTISSGTTTGSTSTDSANTSGTTAATPQTDSTGADTTKTSSKSDPTDVDQNVTISGADTQTYGQGYKDGYTAGAATVKGATAATTVVRTVGTGSTSTGESNLSATSPKTGTTLPTLPILAVFTFAGILVCGKKAQNL